MARTTYSEGAVDKYIDLAVRRGVNIQPGQELLITAPVDCASFARKAMEAAYKAGAADVHINWRDDLSNRMRFLYAEDRVFDQCPPWQSLLMNDLTERGCAYLNIVSTDPENLKGVEVSRISRSSQAADKAMKPAYERLLSAQVRWSILSIPTEAWAKKVFPGAADGQEAVALLWTEILAACRIDENDPVANWDSHSASMAKRAALLDGYAFDSLHFQNSLGTDLLVRLPEGHHWAGGSETARDGVVFLPNIPTEEIFTAPHRLGVEGTVKGTMPNVYRGNIIDGISLTFREGKVVELSARQGEEHLKAMVAETKGMDRLGEVALVPHDSAISNTGILFYNTLYDENASCHLALGAAYADSVAGGPDMSKEEREAAGLNQCDDHHDFMFGSPDLEITGTTKSGEEVAVFRKGNFVF